MSETGSNEKTDSNYVTGSNEETGDNWSDLSSTNLPQNAEDGELEEEVEGNSVRSSSESEEMSNIEKLLAIQEIYEIYCPSCSSCITGKVILRERKGGKHVDLSVDLKPVEPEIIEPPVNVHVLETRIEDDDQKNKDEGYIFTCLACLKYFVWLGVFLIWFHQISLVFEFNRF